jgi:FdrA protein
MVAEKVIKQARTAKKPVVVCFIGRTPEKLQEGNLYFAGSLDGAAEMAVALINDPSGKKAVELTQKAAAAEFKVDVSKFAKSQKYLRGLFSGGTLAYEAQYILEDYLPKVWANAPLRKENKIPNSLESQEHTIIDLGEDEFTQGRLHPMMDNELRIRRLEEESKDPSVAVIMLDVVIGYGSHPDPAGELGPAVKKAIETAAKAGRHLEVVAVVTGTDDDPQNLRDQILKMKAGGAWVSTSNEEMVRYAGAFLRGINSSEIPASKQPKVAKPAVAANPVPESSFSPADLDILRKDLEAINIGLDSFAKDLVKQGVPTIQVDWKPPAGGNEKLMRILSNIKRHQASLKK